MITPDNLLKFIEENDTDTVFKTLQAMSEKERLTLSAEALRATSVFYFRAAQTQAALTEGFSPEQVEAYFQDEDTPLWKALQHFESAKVAVLYCCDFAELKAADEHGLPTPDYCQKVLSDRRPKWLKKWCTWSLRKWPWHVWQTVSELEQQLLETVKGDPNYYTAIALGM